MTSIGDTLRRERQRRNLELPKIAGELKISVRFLDAMEQDDFGKLPGGVFTKSFIRQYASFLGLDGDELVSGIEPATEPEADIAHLSNKPKPDVPGIDLVMGEESWQSVRERRAPLPSWLKSGVLLVVLMLTCSGVYWWWQRPHHPVLAHEAAPAKATPAQTTPAAPAPPVSQPPQTPTATVTPSTDVPSAATQAPGEQAPKPVESTATPAATAPEIPVFAPNPNATVRVGITADEAVWVRATVNGKIQFSGTLLPHESRNIDADGEIVLRLGNAGGATITLNGKPVGAVGPKGQIRDVQFTSGGLKIVSAAKLVDPLDRL